MLSNKRPEEILDVHRIIYFEPQRNDIVVNSLYIGRSSISCQVTNLDINPDFEYLLPVLPVAS